MTEKPIAIISGVGPGTGAAIVKRFSAGGFRIIALARSVELINSLAQELPDVHAVTCGVSDESQVQFRSLRSPKQVTVVARIFRCRKPVNTLMLWDPPG